MLWIVSVSMIMSGVMFMPVKGEMTGGAVMLGKLTLGMLVSAVVVAVELIVL
jgi:hypothetical protein